MRFSVAKIFRVGLRTSISILILGAMFKIMHWPGANLIMVSAFSAIALMYLFRFLKLESKSVLDYVILGLAISFAVRGTLIILHWPGATISTFVFAALLLLWIWFDGPSRFFNPGKPHSKKSMDQNVINTVLLAGGVLTVIGVTFKLFHWPGAQYLLIVGIALLVISFFGGALKDEE